MAFQSSLPTRPITTPDPDGLKVPSVKCINCASLMVGAITNVSGAKITLRIIFTDGAKNVQGVVPPFTLIAASKMPDWGPSYLASNQDGSEPSYHCDGADYAYIKVDALDPPNAHWTLGASSQ